MALYYNQQEINNFAYESKIILAPDTLLTSYFVIQTLHVPLRMKFTDLYGVKKIKQLKPKKKNNKVKI